MTTAFRLILTRFKFIAYAARSKSENCAQTNRTKWAKLVIFKQQNTTKCHQTLNTLFKKASISSGRLYKFLQK